MNKFGTKSLVVCLTGVLPFLISPSVVAYDPYSNVNWQRQNYINSLDMMGATQLINTYNGSGTAIAQFETQAARVDARFGSPPAPGQPPGELVFGNCTHVEAPEPVGTEWVPNDASGWAPGGSNCKIDWVMCFSGKRLYQLTNGSPPRAQLESRKTDCTVVNEDRAHVTNAATAVATVAPGAKIIAIQLDQASSYAFKRAVEWLLHPSSDTAWYLANEYSEDEATYYENAFDGLSPAEYWNIVATTFSWVVLNSLVDDPDSAAFIGGAFSTACTATPNPNPSVPEPYKYVRDWGMQYTHAELIPQIADTYGYLEFEAEEIYQALTLSLVEYYEPYISMLRDNGIMPFFPAENALLTEKTPELKTFVTPNGIAYPACVSDAFAISGARVDYGDHLSDPANFRRDIQTNSHPTMTDFVVAATGATSYDTPVAAAAVAVLKSSNLAPNADIATVVSYLKQGAIRSGLPKIPAGRSCPLEISYSTLPFPGGSPFFAHASLNCPEEEYTLPVLHLGKSIQLAVQGGLEAAISIILDDD